MEILNTSIRTLLFSKMLTMTMEIRYFNSHRDENILVEQEKAKRTEAHSGDDAR